MQESDKKEFWSMMNIAMELTNHHALSKEAIIVWYAKLHKYNLSVISGALDKWLDNSNRAPTPSDIINLCKPILPVYAQIQKPNNYENNKEKMADVKEAISKLKKPSRDWVSYWQSILNTKCLPMITYTSAITALKNLGVKT